MRSFSIVNSHSQFRIVATCLVLLHHRRTTRRTLVHHRRSNHSNNRVITPIQQCTATAEEEEEREACFHQEENMEERECDMSTAEMEDRASRLDLDILDEGKEIRVRGRGKGIRVICVCMMDRMKGSAREFGVIVTENTEETGNVIGRGK